MSAAAALARAEAAGVRLRLGGDGRVHLEAAAPPPPDVLEALRRWREDVAHLLALRQALAARPADPCDPMPPRPVVPRPRRAMAPSRLDARSAALERAPGSGRDQAAALTVSRAWWPSNWTGLK